MSNKIIQILSVHATVAAAVAASGMDLSYNERAAQDKINQLDNDKSARGVKVLAAYVVEGGKVLYACECDIKLLNEFDPFMSVMDNSPFKPVVIRENEIEIIDLKLSRAWEARKTIAKGGLTVTTIAA